MHRRKLIQFILSAVPTISFLPLTGEVSPNFPVTLNPNYIATHGLLAAARGRRLARKQMRVADATIGQVEAQSDGDTKTDQLDKLRKIRAAAAEAAVKTPKAEKEKSAKATKSTETGWQDPRTVYLNKKKAEKRDSDQR